MSGLRDRKDKDKRELEKFSRWGSPVYGPSKDQLRDQLREALENTARDAIKAAEPRDA